VSVPNENFVHADTDVIFPGEPRSSSSSRTCLRLVNANLRMRVCAREHGRRQISNSQETPLVAR
jgi:hypothetical protein